MPSRAISETPFLEPTPIMRPPMIQDHPSVEIDLNAAIVAVHDYEPMLLAIKTKAPADELPLALPSGPFSPRDHRTLEIGLRACVVEHTGLDLGYAEQLYTFGDRDRHAGQDNLAGHVVSIGYLAISDSKHAQDLHIGSNSFWQSWYRFFPWEDWRNGTPEILTKEIIPRLQSWAEAGGTDQNSAQKAKREDRVRIYFGLDAAGWDEERVIDRYELLYEAGLVDEAIRDRHPGSAAIPASTAIADNPRFGVSMRYDHRRILAVAIGRLRAKIKYRPVIFELIEDEFTLFELQRTVEAIQGSQLHKQNFRRLVESSKLVEPTGHVKTRTGGRPAKLYRFRPEVVTERPAPGVRLKPGHH